MVAQGLSPDTVTYNILIKAFIGSNNLDSAKQIFKEMVHSGISPDSISINTLLQGWVQRKDWANVENFVQELKSSNTLNNNVDIVTFNLLVQGFLRLDTKYNSFKPLQKRLKHWDTYRQIKTEETRQCDPLPSATIWSIFETTTGYSKQTVENKQHIPKDASPQYDANDALAIFQKNTAQQKSRRDEKTIENPFINYFQSGKRKMEADGATYALFIRAFTNNRDYKSASTVSHWMRHRSV
jgi:pentatricopeptide repeat protein